MDRFRKQPEGASHQAVGALMGALAGFGIAARQIFSDYGAAAQLPWVQCVGITMIGGVVGLILATMFGGGTPAEDGTAPTIPPADERERHMKPTDDVEKLMTGSLYARSTRHQPSSSARTRTRL